MWFHLGFARKFRLRLHRQILLMVPRWMIKHTDGDTEGVYWCLEVLYIYIYILSIVYIYILYCIIIYIYKGIFIHICVCVDFYLSLIDFTVNQKMTVSVIFGYEMAWNHEIVTFLGSRGVYDCHGCHAHGAHRSMESWGRLTNGVSMASGAEEVISCPHCSIAPWTKKNLRWDVWG